MLSSPAKQKKKKKNKFPQMMSYLFILRERVFGSSTFWFRCYKLAQDAPEDFFFFKKMA